MSILTGNFVGAVATVLRLALNIYLYIIIARAVLSWVSADPYNPIVRFIHNTTEPLLYRIRSKLPISFGGIDFSPIVVILVIYFLQKFIVDSLYMMSQRMLLG